MVWYANPVDVVVDVVALLGYSRIYFAASIAAQVCWLVYK